jgi:hypothetical protein
MFRPQPFKVGLIKPPVNNMRLGPPLKPLALNAPPQVYQQVQTTMNRAKNSIERIKH